MAYSVTHNYFTRNVNEYIHVNFTVTFYRRVFIEESWFGHWLGLYDS